MKKTHTHVKVEVNHQKDDFTSQSPEILPPKTAVHRKMLIIVAIIILLVITIALLSLNLKYLNVDLSFHIETLFSTSFTTRNLRLLSSVCKTVTTLKFDCGICQSGSIIC